MRTAISADHALRDATIAWLVVGALVAVFVQMPWTYPAIGSVGASAVALLFLGAPFAIAAIRHEDVDAYGFAFVARDLRIAAVALAIIVPVFAGGYIGFYELACHSSLGSGLSVLPMRGMCAAYGGVAALHAPPLDGDLLQFIPVQVIVVALPEELMFRGCLLGLLEAKWPPARRIAGGGVGLALIVSSLAFAAIHLPRDGGDPRALATFFPGLVFGWMRSRTHSITASTATHAGCNILVHVLDLAVHR